MAKSSITEISANNTFQVWLDKTNELVDLVKNDIITASLASADGDLTIGNAKLQGTFTSDSVTVINTLRTDNISPKIGSNVITSSAPVNITTNQNILGTLSSTVGPRIAFTDNTASWQIGFENNLTKSFIISSPSTGNSFRINSDGNAIITGNVSAATFSGSLTGNAATATKLFSTRSINGTQFDGSTDIVTATWGTERTVTIGSTSKQINGSANFSWSISEIGAVPVTRTFLNGTGLTGFGDLSANRTPALTGQALALHNVATTGFIARGSDGTIRTRIISGDGTSIQVSNPSGDAGFPIVSAIIPTKVEAEVGLNSTKLMTPQRTIDTINANAIRGYIVFDGSTGVVIKSRNLTLVKSGTGNYSITCATSIRDGSSNWGVVITNIDNDVLTQTPTSVNASTVNNFQTEWWNASLTTRTSTGFTVRAKRTYSQAFDFNVGDDRNMTVAFGITALDPTYIALIVF
jgi:hypothetical protein